MLEAKSRLQEISNELFEELASDVYDEVDRRETDSCKQEVPNSISVTPVIVFLSVADHSAVAELYSVPACQPHPLPSP